ncbi:dTDP-4-dehydrorhamnose reductase [Candidatus Contendibacter odensensis]|uniref:dTDP-4-dehydrorhamnose reductase n=1 Tax=Candidatus Contendobacter odensis Run_B_J11 TaxID=1400861 RepID=A0A7U7G8M3_9GAMM|nr:dTDP-4-dehydrorhamnose reductase [Candidatus Contendobacter odensis]MBK8750417.1 dTDP-4-dehydrorhamnose reductase [Candidatus Competibacteraceae bacterium]CDH43935.1 dTDP-4-dehydrorhamnose reductase subunit, NAD(P)-binding, of dTDP-L-rhamnose synthase [Candidatus Contendobacter odensis Run_B_J11]
MRIAVIGAKGQVGWELARRAPLLGHEALAWDMAELDITDAVAVDRALAVSGADAVINAAAYTAVDKAEQEPELAFAVNRDGPAHLAAACNRLHIPLLHISTDYVYDGNKPSPYVEDDPVAPLGVYGQSKAEGDDAVLRLLPRHLILRVSWVFGIHGHNFVKTMLRLAQEREELRVVADQFGCPTYAGDIADTLLELAGRTAEIDASGAWGTYHYCGAPATTWHGFASAIIEQAPAVEVLRVQTITAITTADYPTPAARPANSVLDSSRLAFRFGIQPRRWRDGLHALLVASYAG